MLLLLWWWWWCEEGDDDAANKEPESEEGVVPAVAVAPVGVDVDVVVANNEAGLLSGEAPPPDSVLTGLRPAAAAASAAAGESS